MSCSLSDIVIYYSCFVWPTMTRDQVWKRLAICSFLFLNSIWTVYSLEHNFIFMVWHSSRTNHTTIFNLKSEKIEVILTDKLGRWDNLTKISLYFGYFKLKHWPVAWQFCSQIPSMSALSEIYCRTYLSINRKKQYQIYWMVQLS